MRTQIKKDKIEAALELLNAAAQEKKEEVFDVLGDKYEHLKEFFESAAHNGEAIAEQTKKQLDKKVRKAPWAFLGGIALGSVVLGLILAGKK